MAGRKRATLSNASVAALERALAKRNRDVERLEKRRVRLLDQLKQVDADLAAVTGGAAAAAKPSARGGRRPRGKMTLNDAIAVVLKDADKGLRAADVMEAVQRVGYKSKAKNFKQIVHSTLTRHPNARRVSKGVYEYQEAPAATAETTRRKKRKSTKRRRKAKTATTA